MSFSERLKEAMEYRHYRQTDLSRKTMIDKGTISNYLSGKYEPKNINLKMIADALDVNALWLLETEGVPMEKETYVEHVLPNNDSSNYVTSIEWDEGYETNITREKWASFYDELMAMPEVMRTDVLKFVGLAIAMAGLRKQMDERSGEKQE